MKLLCDEMLKGLARWLRAAGYDTHMEPDGAPDRRVLERAIADGRCLLTRDRHLLQFRGAAGVVIVLTSNDLPGSVAELGRRLPIDWLRDPFSRCLLCNCALEPADATAATSVPAGSRERMTRADRCPCCGRVYWDGSHVGRMRAQLDAWHCACTWIDLPIYECPNQRKLTDPSWPTKKLLPRATPKNPTGIAT